MFDYEIIIHKLCITEIYIVFFINYKHNSVVSI